MNSMNFKQYFLPSIFLLCLSYVSFSQEGNPEDYYYQIPEYPSEYNEGTVAARVVDGLGFRYYWATEGLTSQNLAFKPSEEARSAEETIDHILSLTSVMRSAVKGEAFGGIEIEGMSFDQKRNQTLDNIKFVSETLKAANVEDLADFNIVFSSGAEFPFWNLLNGPIADAINHVGQIVTFRRSAGNPINPNISVLRGSKRD